MKKIATLCVALSVLSSVVALAAPQTSKPAPKKSTKSTVKLVDLWTCPMTGEAVKDHTVKASDPVVGKYRVHFCCAGCPESFAKLSAKEKQAKVAELAKKSTSTKKS
jgi:hypothetical protein